LIDQLCAAAKVADFMKNHNLLDADGFQENYATMLSSDICHSAPSQFKDCLETRIEIRRKYDAVMDNPTAFSEAHIQTICNWVIK